MKTFRDIIELWESRADLARDLGRRPGTVQVWYDRNSIPGNAWADIVTLANQSGHSAVTPALMLRLGAHRGVLPEPAGDGPALAMQEQEIGAPRRSIDEGRDQLCDSDQAGGDGSVGEAVSAASVG